MLENDYRIRKWLITKRSPQAKTILERIHKTIENILRTFRVQQDKLDKKDPLGGISAVTMFATKATVHTTL